jgi:hypothetical protein
MFSGVLKEPTPPFHGNLSPHSYTLMMEVEGSSETLVNTYQATRRHISEDSLHSHRS